MAPRPPASIADAGQPEIDEEQTQRSAKAPQRVRMSLRMRRVAAGPAPTGGLSPSADDRVALRLAGRLFELPTSEQVFAGRSTQCQLVLGDRLCSRRHASFTRAQNGVTTVRDLSSSNGTYVNGIRIKSECRLVLGDWITIGNETFELCISTDQERAATPTIPVRARRQAESDDGVDSALKTDPGSPLLSIASFTAQASRQTPTPVAAHVAKKPLNALLRQAERGEPIDPSAPEMAALLALRMAGLTQDGSWLSYCFRLYAALCLPFSAELLERLQEVLLCVPQLEAAPFHAYVELMTRLEQSAPDKQRRALLEQLAALRACFD